MKQKKIKTAPSSAGSKGGVKKPPPKKTVKKPPPKNATQKNHEREKNGFSVWGNDVEKKS